MTEIHTGREKHSGEKHTPARKPNNVNLSDELNNETTKSWSPKWEEYTKTQAKMYDENIAVFWEEKNSNQIPQITTKHINQPSKGDFHSRIFLLTLNHTWHKKIRQMQQTEKSLRTETKLEEEEKQN